MDWWSWNDIIPHNNNNTNPIIIFLRPFYFDNGSTPIVDDDEQKERANEWKPQFTSESPNPNPIHQYNDDDTRWYECSRWWWWRDRLSFKAWRYLVDVCWTWRLDLWCVQMLWPWFDLIRLSCLLIGRKGTVDLNLTMTNCDWWLRMNRFLILLLMSFISYPSYSSSQSLKLEIVNAKNDDDDDQEMDCFAIYFYYC